MKHAITALATLVTFLFSCFAHGAGTIITKDSERIATEFVTRKADYYKGTAYLDQTMTDGSSNWLYSLFTLEKGKITQFRLFSKAYPDGVEIPIPAGGLRGFPRNTVGETRNFSLWLDGYDQNGNFVSYSDQAFYDDLFQQNEQIIVTLVPAYRVKSIAFPRSRIPAGVNPDNLTLRYGSNWAPWSAYYEGFQIWINPLEVAEWVLYDRSTGFVYPFDPSEPPAPSPYAGIGIKYAGETVQIDWTESDYLQLYGQFLGGIVLREDVEVSGKTYFTDLEGDGMSIYVANLMGKAEVFSVDEDGTLTLVKTADVDAAEWSYLSLPTGYGKIIVTFTGTVTYSGGFVVEFIRQRSKSSGTVGAG